MKARLFLAAMLFPGMLVAGDLKLVAKIPYESLRGEIPALVPGHDYGDRGVELWADPQGGCFQSRDDVVALFKDWLKDGFAGHWLPHAVDLLCFRAAQGNSLAVVSETSVHGAAPNELDVFEVSAPGSHVLRRLSSANIGGSAMVRDPSTEFLIEGDQAVGVLYCDRRDEDGLNCWAFLTTEGFRERRFYVPSLYRIERRGERRFLAVTGVEGHKWAIQRIGARVSTVGSVYARPRGDPGALTGRSALRAARELNAFLARFRTVVQESGAVRVLDSGYLHRYAGALSRRASNPPQVLPSPRTSGP